MLAQCYVAVRPDRRQADKSCLHEFGGQMPVGGNACLKSRLSLAQSKQLRSNGKRCKRALRMTWAKPGRNML